MVVRSRMRRPSPNRGNCRRVRRRFAPHELRDAHAVLACRWRRARASGGLCETDRNRRARAGGAALARAAGALSSGTGDAPSARVRSNRFTYGTASSAAVSPSVGHNPPPRDQAEPCSNAIGSTGPSAMGTTRPCDNRDWRRPGRRVTPREVSRPGVASPLDASSKGSGACARPAPCAVPAGAGRAAEPKDAQPRVPRRVLRA
jgi:hypothetical protein